MEETSAKEIARRLMPLEREENDHKYDHGHLLVIGGNQAYSGSPALNSLAAYRTGVDLVTTAAPERSADIIASFSPSLIAYPLQGNYLSSWHLDQLLKLSSKTSAAVIGGGLGRKRKTKQAIVRYLKNTDLPCVIDADAIRAVAETKESVLSSNHLLTPHRREFEVLRREQLGQKDEEKERKLKVSSASSKLNCTILLKGKEDLISDGETTVSNETGNAFLTKGGTGDTLAGIAGSLLAQGLDPLQAGSAAAYLNGRAGSLAAEEKAEGMLAEEIIDKLPQAIKELT